MCIFSQPKPKAPPTPAPAPAAPVVAPTEQAVGAKRKAEEDATFGGRPSFRVNRKTGLKTGGAGGSGLKM